MFYSLDVLFRNIAGEKKLHCIDATQLLRCPFESIEVPSRIDIPVHWFTR